MDLKKCFALFIMTIAVKASFGQLAAPQFSHSPGIYDNPFTLSITHLDPGAVIRYTTNGSEPNSNSPVYSGAGFEIVDRTSEPNDLSMIRTTPASVGIYSAMWKPPVGNVAKGTVIRAAAFKSGERSEILSGSFFVFSEDSPYRSLPLISIISDRTNFFGHNEGIYVPGANHISGDDWTGNYYMKGDEWEREGSFEYFDTDGNTQISQNVGYRIHGAWTRRNPQKSLRVYARKRYGNETLDFPEPLFHNFPYKSFKRLILRMGGNDCEVTFIRDASAQYMLSHVKTFDIQAFRSAVVFLNGEFWGLHNIRERYDEHYLNRVYGVDPDNLDRLDFWSGGSSVSITPDQGDEAAYREMEKFARENDLSNKAALDSMLKLMDIDSYLDFYAIQIYLNNNDGIYHNHKIWRERRNYRQAPTGRDGRFRWLIVDLDQIVDIWGQRKYTLDSLFREDHLGNELFLNLMKNDWVKQSFINSFANLLNSAYLPGRAEAVIDSIVETITPIVEPHIDRWRMLGYGYPSSWNTYINDLKSGYQSRAISYRNTVRTFFSAGEDRTVTLMSDTTHGFIKINTMVVDSKLPGAPPQTYPWSGRYFENVPITVSGAGKPYYRIEKWIVNGTVFEDSVLTIDLSEDKPYDIEAFFVYDSSYIITSTRNAPPLRAQNFTVSHRVRSRANVTFDLTLPQAGNVDIRVYNLAGKEVAIAARGNFGAGRHQVDLNMGKIASGVYVYRVKALNKTLAGRLRI